MQQSIISQPRSEARRRMYVLSLPRLCGSCACQRKPERTGYTSMDGKFNPPSGPIGSSPMSACGRLRRTQEARNWYSADWNLDCVLENPATPPKFDRNQSTQAQTHKPLPTVLDCLGQGPFPGDEGVYWTHLYTAPLDPANHNRAPRFVAKRRVGSAGQLAHVGLRVAKRASPPG